MTKVERLIAAANLIEEAELVIACQKGILARAHKRPREGVLVPKECREGRAAAEFRRGWDHADEQLAE